MANIHNGDCTDKYVLGQNTACTYMYVCIFKNLFCDWSIGSGRG